MLVISIKIISVFTCIKFANRNMGLSLNIFSISFIIITLQGTAFAPSSLKCMNGVTAGGSRITPYDGPSSKYCSGSDTDGTCIRVQIDSTYEDGHKRKYDCVE